VYSSKVWLNRISTLQHIRLEFKKKLLKCHIWSLSLYGAETFTLWKIDQKYLGSFEMWCWRRMEKISCVWNEEVLHRVKDERNILHKKKANWIGHFLHRNCLLKHVIEGRTEGMINVTGRYGRRCQQPMDDLNEKRGCWKLKQEALDSILWRTCFGKGYGPVVKRTTEWMKEWVEWMNEQMNEDNIFLSYNLCVSTQWKRDS